MLQATGYPAEISDFYSAISAGKKTENKFQSSVLLNGTKTTTTGAEKSHQIFTHLTMHMHEISKGRNFATFIDFLQSRGSRTGRISDASWQNG